MITFKEIKAKCQKYWQAQHIQRSVLFHADPFPLVMSKIRFTARELSEGFPRIREELQQLQAESKTQKGFGYTLHYQSIQHRQLGRQNVPYAVVFETLQDFLKWTGLNETYRSFCNSAQMILQSAPALLPWLQEHTDKVLEFKDHWPQLLAVAFFLEAHPRPNCYLRELPIPGIDSKFIEQHQSILRDILNELLAPEYINTEVQNLQNHGFERRYGFKYPEPLIRFRILDTALFHYSMSDISLPLSEFRKAALPCENIIITENKTNGLALPMTEGTIVIFGLGYGIQSLAGIPWLQNKALYYWGDIDTHGFAMLSQLRAYYPQVKNLFMDEVTLHACKSMAVEEALGQRCLANLPNLSEPEQALYQALRQNVHGNNIRIEQERIDFKYVLQRLKQIFILSGF